MSNTDYGKKINKCFHAIIQLYSDCRKLLTDCDGQFFPDAKPIHGNTITREVTHTIDSPKTWLPFGLYRYWYLDHYIGGLEILLFDEEKRFDEPLLAVGKIHFTDENDTDFTGLEFTLWDTVLEEDTLHEHFGEVFKDKPPHTDYVRIDRISFCVEPLYNIKDINDVKKLFEKCGVDINDERAK